MSPRHAAAALLPGLAAVLILSLPGCTGQDSPAAPSATAPATPVPAAPAGPPLAPVDLTAASNGQGVIELRWNAPPADPARQPVTGYRVEWSGDGNANWTPVDPAHTGAATSYLHTGLTPETTLHYRVFATSAGGDSPASTVAVATTEQLIAVTVEFVEETVTIREGETRALGIRYRIAELAAPLPVRISVLPTDAEPADYELSEGRFEVPAGSGVNGSVEVSLGAQTDRAFAEGDEELLLRLVAGTGARAELGADLRVVIADAPVSPCDGVLLGGTPPEPTETTADRIRTSLSSAWGRSADGVTMEWVGPYGKRWEWTDVEHHPLYTVEAKPYPPQPDFHVESWRIVPGATTTHLMDVHWPSGVDLEMMFRCEDRQVVAVCRRQGCELAP